MGDMRPAMLAILKQRPTSYGLPQGSNISKIRPEVIIEPKWNVIFFILMSKNK